MMDSSDVRSFDTVPGQILTSYSHMEIVKWLKES